MTSPVDDKMSTFWDNFEIPRLGHFKDRNEFYVWIVGISFVFTGLILVYWAHRMRLQRREGRWIRQVDPSMHRSWSIRIFQHPPVQLHACHHTTSPESVWKHSIAHSNNHNIIIEYGIGN